MINPGSSFDNNNNNNNDQSPKDKDNLRYNFAYPNLDSVNNQLSFKKHESSKSKHQSKDLLGKKKARFTAIQLPNSITPKELKLIQNRMSAKKSREKKKEYIEEIENELAKTKRELNEYKEIINKNKAIQAYINQMRINEEKAFNQILLDSELEEIKREYQVNQSILLNQLLNQLFQTIIPLELKLFYLKFLKLEEINDKDDIESIETKTVQNINM